MENHDNELIGASSGQRRGRPRKGKRPCQTEGCGNNGSRYIDGLFVCSTCRSRHDRQTKNLCSVRGCSGVVRLGKKRPRRYCQSHSIRYLTDAPKRRDGALAELAQRITFDNIGKLNCWMEAGELGRATIEVNGLRWVAVRYLWIVFYGQIRGGLQLHHVCGNSWCLNPSHCEPTTGTMNQEIEDHLDEYGGEKFLAHFAPITEEFDQWCRFNGLDHGMTDRINDGSRRYVEIP